MRSVTRNAAAVALTAVAAILIAAGPAFAGTWVPNRTSDSQTFKNMRYGGETLAQVDYTSSGWKHWTEWGGFGGIWVWPSATTENVWVYANGAVQLFCDFAAPAGTSWPVSIPGCNTGRVTLAQKNVTVQTAAGTFSSCILLTLIGNCNDAGVTSITFAPGIGIVQFTEDNIAGEVRQDFARGTVNGASYPQTPSAGLKVCAYTDAYEYWIDMEPPGPNPPTSLYASIEVTNTTGADIPHIFNSGQSFEIVVRNGANAIVSRWSRGRYFTMAFRNDTLNQGETWTFGGSVTLTDDSGNALPSGDYTVEIYVTANPKMMASFRIKIGWAV